MQNESSGGGGCEEGLGGVVSTTNVSHLLSAINQGQNYHSNTAMAVLTRVFCGWGLQLHQSTWTTNIPTSKSIRADMPQEMMEGTV